MNTSDEKDSIYLSSSFSDVKNNYLHTHTYCVSTFTLRRLIGKHANQSKTRRLQHQQTSVPDTFQRGRRLHGILRIGRHGRWRRRRRWTCGRMRDGLPSKVRWFHISFTDGYRGWWDRRRRRLQRIEYHIGRRWWHIVMITRCHRCDCCWRRWVIGDHRHLVIILLLLIHWWKMLLLLLVLLMLM